MDFIKNQYEIRWVIFGEILKQVLLGEIFLTIIGVTGGIGSGKSTVSCILSDLGAIIIDADKIARRLLPKENLPG